MFILLKILFIFTVLNIYKIESSQHEDVRCKCVCPDPNVLLEEFGNTSTKTDGRKLYIDNVPPQHCNCDWMVLTKLDQDYRKKSKELCPRCECIYESRNLKTIKLVITGIVCMISFLVIYMVFLYIIEYFNNNGRMNYQVQINEEVSMDNQNSNDRRSNLNRTDENSTRQPKNVINKVNQQQSKWKKQVIEQRKNIYDRHSMLN